MRAVGYPLVVLHGALRVVDVWRERMSFPWLPDLLVTITCFTDILGNRMDLYDTVVWFDDWMHFMNTGLLAAAFILLTLPRDSGLRARRRAVPGLRRDGGDRLGAGGVLRLPEQVLRARLRVRRHARRPRPRGAGALVAAVLVQRSWRSGRLLDPVPPGSVQRANLTTISRLA